MKLRMLALSRPSSNSRKGAVAVEGVAGAALAAEDGFAARVAGRREAGAASRSNWSGQIALLIDAADVGDADAVRVHPAADDEGFAQHFAGVFAGAGGHVARAAARPWRGRD